MNLYQDNADLRFHIERAVAWERFVPQWEEGFRFADGPRDLAEARETYQASLRELGEFAAREIAPRAREIDEQGVGFEGGEVVHPPALLKNIAGLKQLGVMGVSLPRDVGGFNFPFTVSVAMLEIVSRACTNTMLLYGFHQGPAVMVLRFGTPDQIERWVKPLASGAISGSVAMTEPDAGSDIGNLSTAAILENDGWRLTGRKQFITNGCGEICVVLARSEPGSKGLEGLSLFVVPRHQDGRANYTVARPEKKFVIRGSATCELAFDGSRAELLGPRGSGFRQVLTFMNEARLAVAIQGLGVGQAAFEAARDYAGRRVQMGQPIARHPMIADLLLDMEAELAALRAFVYQCAELQDRILGLERPGAKPAPAELRRLKRELRDRTPLLKWFGSERCLWLTRAAVQVHGGYGVVQEYDVERHYRNALILPIYEGTSQIQGLMSLKDQIGWALEKPWRLVAGPASVNATPDIRGDLLRDMVSEYNRALRYVMRESIGLRGVMAASRARGRARSEASDAPGRQLDYALLHAERLTAMLAYTRAAEALLAHAGVSERHAVLADRFLGRALPQVRMLGEIVRSGDRSALMAEA